MKNLPVLFLFFLLVSCTPAVTEVTAPTETPVPTATVIPSPPTSTATEIPSIPSPIDPENMDLLTRAGYLWDEKTGSLNNKKGNAILSFEDGKWVDKSGVESSLESLKINLTNGVDFDGNDIHAILTREVDGQLEMYNFIVNEWQEPMDIEASMQAVSKNNIEKTLKNWKKHVEIDFEGVSEASWKDFLSGRLFLSDLLNLKPLPENANIQPLIISRESIIQNHWTLGQFLAGHNDYYGEPFSGTQIPPNKDRPVLAENDAIRVVSAHKMKSPLTGEWLSVTGVRYQVNGRDLILYLFTGGKTTIPTEDGGAYNLVEDFWSYPARRILLPVVSTRKGDPCGLGAQYASQPVCDLVGYDVTPVPRKLMPPDLQAMMAEFDSDELLTSIATETYPVEGDWIFALQRAVLPANIKEHGGIYFLTEDDERLNNMWPDDE